MHVVVHEGAVADPGFGKGAGGFQGVRPVCERL